MTVQSVIDTFDEAIASVDAHDMFAFDIETTGLDPFTTELLVLSLATEDGAWAIPFAGPVPHLPWQHPEMSKRIAHVFSNPNKTGISWNGMFDDKHMIHRGFDLKIKDADGMVGVWLLDEFLAKSKQIGLKKQAKEKLGVDMVEFSETRLLDGIVDQQALDYARDDAKYTYVIFVDFVLPKLEAEGLMKVFTKISMPVLRVLAEMELNGCYIDVDQMKRVETELTEQNEGVLAELRELAQNEKFNPGSSKQLSKLLFGPDSKMKIQVRRGHEWKVKSGQWATDKRTLRRYKNEHPIFERLTAYRKSKKLLTTYAIPLQIRAKAAHDGRVRPHMKQTGTICVRHDTLVPTERGLVEISSLSPTCESVEPFVCEVSTRTGEAATSHIVHNGTRPTRRIRTRMGFELEGTLIHPVWANPELRKGIENIPCSMREAAVKAAGWIKLSNISVGDYVCVRRDTQMFGSSVLLPPFRPVFRTNAKKVSFPRTLTPDLALFTGAYGADGSIHTSNGGGSIRINQSDERAKQRIALAVENSFKVTPSIKEDGVEVVSAELVRYCREVLQFKAGAHLKQVPEFIRSAPRDCVVAYLSGLFLDGTCLTDSFGVRFSSTSQSTARWTHAQLLNCGIVSSLRKDSYVSRTHHVKDDNSECGMWHVTCKGTNAARLADLIEPLKLDMATLFASCPARFHGNGYIERGDAVWLKVQSVVDSTADVWDVTVPGDECFISNGIISHNTGRLSSSQPNGQNIPTKGGVREGFIAPPGKKIVVADYNQLELRMGGFIAHRVFGKSNIVEKYAQGIDLHEGTRQTYDALGVDRFNEATVGAEEARRNAKIANFGYYYGRSADGFYQDNPEVPFPECMMLRELFLVKLYPEIPAMHDHCVKLIVENGYIRTIVARKRRFKHCYGRNPADVWWDGWVAWNSWVQGSAQDLIQIAMRDLFTDIQAGRRGEEVQSAGKVLYLDPEIWRETKILLQVHDELMIEVPEHAAQDVADWMSFRMGNALPGQVVDFPAEAGIGDNWIAAKGATKKSAEDDTEIKAEMEEVA